MTPAPLLLCLCLSVAPSRDRWVAEDKLKHFFASFVVTSVSASAARWGGMDPVPSAWVGAGVGMGVGAWKELRDLARPGSSASVLDLTWDAAGVAAGTVMMRQVQ